MSFWKVLGGVAAGVGAIVCLPVAGPIGAVTAIGAAVGGVVGGAAGAAVAFGDEETEEQLANAKANEEKVKASKLAQEKKFNAQFEEQSKSLKEHEKLCDLIVALFAMGVAAANADGFVSDEENEALDGFVLGIAGSEFPEEIKNSIAEFKSNPPNLITAVALAKKIPNVNWELFATVIKLVIEADDEIVETESAFLQTFHILAA